MAAATMAPRNTTVKVSAAPATASRLSVSHRLGGDREPGEGRAPRRRPRTASPGPAATMCLTGPEKRRAGQAAQADGRGEQAERAGIAAEPFGVDRGEQRHGQAEDGGVEIGEKRAGQHLAAADEARFPRRPRAGPARVRRPRPHGGQPGHPVQRGGEADRVQEIARPQAQVRRGRDEAGQRRAGGQHDLEAEPVQRQPGGQLAGRQQAGDERAAGRAVDGDERGLTRRSARTAARPGAARRTPGRRAPPTPRPGSRWSPAPACAGPSRR